MRTSNLSNQALRHAEIGHVWEEKISGTSGTLELPRYTTFRVRAAGSVTVTMDGVLAMTMTSGEISIFNTGAGISGSGLDTSITVVITGNAYVQVAKP